MSLLATTPQGASAQTASEQSPVVDWCTVPLCQEAAALRQHGDALGALKLYRYIHDEVDVDEKTLRKPLLYFPIAALHAELRQAQLAFEALQKYRQYIADRADSDLPAGQRKEDVERLAQAINILRLRLISGSEPEPPPAGLHPDGKPEERLVLPELPPPQAAETERRIRAGLSLLKQGLRRSARIEFEQAYAVSQNPLVLFSLARLLLSQGQPGEAATYGQRYLDAAPNGELRKDATEMLARVRRELALESEAARITELQRQAHSPQNRPLRRSGIALLSIGGGLLLTGFSLGMGAIGTARRLESAERYEPALESTGRSLQIAGATFDVLGAVSLGVGAACLGIARRREAALPSRLGVLSASAGPVNP